MTVNPNAVSAREAMGLPERFVDRLGDIGSAQAAELGMDTSTTQTALRVLQDGASPLAQRVAAGCILSIFGDPRISAEDPVMVDIAGGPALLGTNPQDVPSIVRDWAGVGVLDEWIRKECPAYEIHLAPFRLARYPVTNIEYRVFLDATGWPAMPSSWLFGAYPHGLANHPVWGINEDALVAYVQWLSSVTGRAFRLPSEAEWEFAACGGDRREYPWGDAFNPHLANTVEAGPLSTTPVGAYPDGRSPFGVDDMAGNIEELVEDVYASYPGGSHVADDLWQTRGAYRVTRGGSFTRYGDLARCRRRHGWSNRDIYAIGFRLAETVG